MPSPFTHRRYLWLFLLALPILLWATAMPIHPQPDQIPSIANPVPPAAWDAAAAQARRLLRTHLSTESVPGLSVAVAIDGQLVWAEGFGIADLKTGRLVTPAVPFRLGSASTLLTTAAVHILRDEGRLRLEDEIQIHLPNFPKKQWPLTLAHLLGDSSGLPPGDGDTNHCTDTSQPLLFQPGTRRSSSPLGWIILTRAIESASGQPFSRFLGQRIAAPFAMNGTSLATAAEPDDGDHPLFNLIRERVFDPRAMRRANAAPASLAPPAYYLPRYLSLPAWGLYQMCPLDLSCSTGAAAILATPSDLVRFAAAHPLTAPRDGQLPLAAAPVVHIHPAGRYLIALAANIPDAGLAALAARVAQALDVANRQ